MIDSEFTSAGVEIGVDIIDTQALDSYVLGYPMHVAITLRQRGYGILRFLPMADVFESNTCIGFELRDSTNRRIAGHEPHPVIDPAGFDIPLFELRDDEERRLLVDLSDQIPADVPAGEYSLTMMYGSDYPVARGAVVPLSLRAPNAAERRGGEREERTDWSRWTLADWVDAPQKLPAARPDDPMRFNTVLRYLLRGPRSPATAPLTVLDGLPDLYAPDVAALTAELLAARRYHQAATEIHQEATRQWRGIAWRFEQIARGSGMLTTKRRG